jgi:uncharacterized membrane protein (UPF0127 family)
MLIKTAFTIFAFTLISGCDHIPDHPLCKQKKGDFVFGNTVLNTEIACSNIEKSTGLMNRKFLAPNNGMIFVYEKQETLPFWMKNTLIPLSIAFIDQNWKIVDIQEMQPLDEHIIYSAQPALYAVEANPSWFLQHNVHIGDTVYIKQ